MTNPIPFAANHNSLDGHLLGAEDSIDLQAINTEDLLQCVGLELDPMSLMKDPHEYISQQNHLNHPHLERNPDLCKVESDYKFEVTINGDNNNNNWHYLPVPEKLFIKMNAVINFHLSYVPYPGDLHIRAMIVFTNPDEMHLPVKRCANHREQDVGHNIHHILRCCDNRAQYHGRDDGLLFKDRLSIILPLGQLQPNEENLITEKIGLQFLCQNSCASGINRRTTSVMFTLEDETNLIVGKKVVQVKVCSCPKRDASREEPPNKRKSVNVQIPIGKKPKYQLVLNPEHGGIKIEPGDSPLEQSLQVAESPNAGNEVALTLQLPKDIMSHVLECAFNKIAGVMAKDKEHDPQYYTKYLKHIEGLRTAYQ